MEAFVPTGANLSSSRVFLTGDSRLSPRTPSPRTSHAPISPPTPVPITAIKLPSFSELFKNFVTSLPKLPLFARDPEPAPSPVNTTLSIGGVKVPPSKKPSNPVTIGIASKKGLPKFYNPTTARHQFRATTDGQGATEYDVRQGARGATPINDRVNDQGGFRNMDLYTEELIWARPDWSPTEAATAVRVAIRNIFGNANLFESELAELSAPISCVKETGDIKEFVRALGLSDAYRTRFFEKCSNTRFVETNFKHFLGRAPHSQEEVSKHIAIITEQGYNAEINSYVDSAEYDTLWGATRIPAVNFRGGHPYNNDMNKLSILNGSFMRSDRVTTKAFFPSGDIAGLTPFSIYKGLPEAWRGENEARNASSPIMSYSNDIFWNPAPIGLREAEIAWIAKYGNWTNFWYKDSIVYTDVMKPYLYHSDQEIAKAKAALKYGTLMSSSYTGVRKEFDMAPVIEIVPPTSTDGSNGYFSVKMTKISYSIPSELLQEV